MMSKNKQSWILEDLLKKWEGNKTYMLGVLEAMPEADYAFTPAPGMMSFQEQAVHIEYAFHYHWRATTLPPLPQLDASDKASILASFNQVFDQIIAAFGQMIWVVLCNLVWLIRHIYFQLNRLLGLMMFFGMYVPSLVIPDPLQRQVLQSVLLQARMLALPLTSKNQSKRQKYKEV